MENIFKDKLSEYSEQPPAHVWERIVEKRSKGHIWWNYFRLNGMKYAAIILLVTVAAYFLWPRDSKNQSVNNISIQTENNLESNQPQVATVSPESNKNIIEDETGSDNVDVRNESSYKSGGNAITVNGYKNTFPKGISKDKPEGITNPDKFSGEDGDNNDIDIVKGTENNKQPELPVIETPEVSPVIPDNAEKPEEVIAESTIEDPIKDVKVIQDQEETPGEKGKKINDISPMKSWAIEILYGPYWGATMLEGSNTPLLKVRNESESTAAGWMSSVRIGKQLGNHWEAVSGVSLISRKENINYEVQRNYLRMDVKETYVTVYHPVLPPATKMVSDTSYTPVVQNETRIRQNQYTAVSIPLIFRYNYYFKRLSVFGAAGVLADIHSYRNSEILNESGEFVPGSSVMSNKVQGRIYGGAGIKYKAGHHWSLLAEPVVTIGLNNQASQDYSLKQREKGYGINAGIRYEF